MTDHQKLLCALLGEPGAYSGIANGADNGTPLAIMRSLDRLRNRDAQEVQGAS